MAYLEQYHAFRAELASDPEILEEVAEYKKSGGGRCPILSAEKDGYVKDWMESTTTFFDHTAIYAYTPCAVMDPTFLYWTFHSMEQSMIRQALIRCQPEFKKEVGTGLSQARIFVGTLQEPQWEEYKKSKASSNPSQTSHKTRKPAFNNTKIEGRIETLTWDANVQSMPVLANLERWYLNKWKSVDQTLLWRAWIRMFCIKWNSHNGMVHIAFKYCTQHYENEILKVWIHD
jgi:hypothetical protein